MKDSIKTIVERRRRTMPLNRFVPNSMLSMLLLEPLVFGNPRQISALADLEEDIEKLETKKAQITEEKVKCFDVTIEYGGTQEFRVLAVDEADAKEKAQEKACHNEADIEADSISVREIKK